MRVIYGVRVELSELATLSDVFLSNESRSDATTVHTSKISGYPIPNFLLVSGVLSRYTVYSCTGNERKRVPEGVCHCSRNDKVVFRNHSMLARFLPNLFRDLDRRLAFLSTEKPLSAYRARVRVNFVRKIRDKYRILFSGER